MWADGRLFYIQYTKPAYFSSNVAHTNFNIIRNVNQLSVAPGYISGMHQGVLSLTTPPPAIGFPCTMYLIGVASLHL